MSPNTLWGPKGPSIAFYGLQDGLHVTTDLAAAAHQRLREELAYYHADAPFLPVEKCAARCRQLSALLTAASVHSTVAPGVPLAYTP